MGKIYKGQSDLTVRLETGKNLTGITNVKIAFRRPSQTTGEWVANVVDAAKGIIEYNLINTGQINVFGEWTFWAKIVDAQGLISIGEPTTIQFYEEGK